MRVLANIASFFSMVFGFIISTLSKFTDVIDDSVVTITGIIGAIGAVVWLSIALIKRREAKVRLENERLENKIKKQQLKNLSETEI